MTENEKTSATEMTDNEIIKALESCNALVKMRTCKTCPLYTFEGCCTAEMLRQTVNLIKRKDEQIESLIAGQETLQKYIAEKDAEIETLRSRKLKQSVEIDTLRNSSKTSTGIIEKLENKLKTMTTEVERLSNINQSLTNHLTNTRTEAVKEFAERLKKLSRNLYPFSDEPIIDCKDVDNLVKEMVGEG